MRRRATSVFFLLLVLSFFSGTPACRPAKEPVYDPNALNPPITLARVATIQSLFQEAHGKVVVLNLWATWCVPCAGEMPGFIRFYQDYRKNDAVFISLSTDDPGTAQTQVRNFQKARAIPFPIHVLEERDPDALGKVLQTEFTGALPVTLVYGRDGTLKKTWTGPITLEELLQTVQALR